jgi:hypothetical protein
MRAIIVRVDGTSAEFDVPLITDYEDGYPATCIDRGAIARAIGADMAECVPVVAPTPDHAGIEVFVDSQGRVIGKPSNAAARKVAAALAGVAESEATAVAAGDVLFFGWGNDNDEVGLTDDQAANINSALKQLANIVEAPVAEPRSSRVPLLKRGQAKGMAESMWGSGGTTARQTNRAGAFYFSCSGHGGFVIDDLALSERERELLTEAGFSADQCWGVRAASGQIKTIRHPHSQVPRSRPVTYVPGLGEYPDHAIPVWTFEEDCDWAAVYGLTGIRTPGAFSATEEEMVAYALESLGRWHPEAAEVAARIAGEAPAREAGLRAADGEAPPLVGPGEKVEAGQDLTASSLTGDHGGQQATPSPGLEL